MRDKFFYFINILLLTLLPAFSSSAKTPLPELLGSWYFEGPQSIEWGSPAKEMVINFNELGRSELLVWTREGEGACRRTAIFWYDENTKTLHQTAIQLDPHSPTDCLSIPEMNVGTETRHQVKLEGNRMVLRNEVATNPEVSEWTFAFP
ncbi:MAG: hypothetical protein KF789_03410 [Bdellovibrionaceae bacterium]|nr:hypothetical protein [Pseudobdellovibrionaceae bacterium]